MARLNITMASKLSLVETEMAMTSTGVISAVQTAHQDTILLYQDMQNRLAALETLVTTQNERARDHLNYQQCSRLSGARLFGTPAMLREACDIASSTSISGTSIPAPGGQWIALSRCVCDLREKVRPVAFSRVRLGGTVLSNEYYKVSRHSPYCPLYTRSKAQRRVSARLRVGLWSRIPILVEASIACTTGAGGFSISPQLSFRMTVDWRSPAVVAIEKTFPWDVVPCETDMVKKVAAAERTILNLFRAGEASPYDQLPFGWNLLHARCSYIFEALFDFLANETF